MKGLKLSQLRYLEAEFGFEYFFGPPREIVRCMEQQFGVYDEDDNHIRDVVANKMFFTEEELRNHLCEISREG